MTLKKAAINGLIIELTLLRFDIVIPVAILSGNPA
jgi:hypothetical protein